MNSRGMDLTVTGQNGIGQNGTDKWYGQNGTDRRYKINSSVFYSLAFWKSRVFLDIQQSLMLDPVLNAKCLRRCIGSP